MKLLFLWSYFDGVVAKPKISGRNYQLYPTKLQCDYPIFYNNTSIILALTYASPTSLKLKPSLANG